MFSTKNKYQIVGLLVLLIICAFNMFVYTFDKALYFYLDNNTLQSVSQVSAQDNNERTVWLGGDVVGFEYQSKGVLVLGKNKLFTHDSFVDNLPDDELMQGDIITEVNGCEVNTPAQIESMLNDKNAKIDVVNIKAIRKGKEYNTNIKPAYDLLTHKYKLGLWVKNTINGIGTLTYIDKQTNRYGALGHHIVEPNTNVELPVNSGALYGCTLLGIKRSVRGCAGEMRGILKTDAILGDVDKNLSSGIYGNMTNNILSSKRTSITLGGKDTVVPGKALIYCCIDGKNVRAYDIEIIKTNRHNTENRNMVIKITDQRLIKATGGIVQGMSGSPIVQNGKLIGAVTHVFVNDATKGFGIFVDHMIHN